MAFGNVGIGLVLPLLVLISWVVVIVVIFQIRNTTRDTSEKLEAIYKLLLENKNSN